jgi:hypothetical protein
VSKLRAPPHWVRGFFTNPLLSDGFKRLWAWPRTSSHVITTSTPDAVGSARLAADNARDHVTINRVRSAYVEALAGLCLASCWRCAPRRRCRTWKRSRGTAHEPFAPLLGTVQAKCKHAPRHSTTNGHAQARKSRCLQPSHGLHYTPQHSRSGLVSRASAVRVGSSAWLSKAVVGPAERRQPS